MNDICQNNIYSILVVHRSLVESLYIVTFKTKKK